ncbi:MAG TPA: ATP-binding protein [Xanthobacteraceae bacterium]|nr:ATP-binding protein [Xanthobacteraceae bacterium]
MASFLRLRRLSSWMLNSRLIIAVTALVFLLFSALEILTPVGALFGFLLISVATALAMGPEAVPAEALPDQINGIAGARAAAVAVIESLPDPVIVLDRHGDIVGFNRWAAALAPAMRRGEPVTLSLRMPELTEAIRESRRTWQPRRVEISERVPHDRWYEVFVVPFVTSAQVAPELPQDLIILSFRDLTPLRRVEEMRADFVANASHELRTPLAALLGFIETLQGPARNDAAARERFLGIMQSQAGRMARLIDDLLSLSRIELNLHRKPDTPVDIISALRQVCDSLQTLARDRGVTIEAALPDSPVMIAGDRDELMRLFENLIENGLKYGASGGRVLVTFQPPSGKANEASITVRDFGPGIAPEHLPRLTERFYRADVGESRAQGGTGLGLALVKHILNRHGGRLSIESQFGKGASFIARVPLLPEVEKNK